MFVGTLKILSTYRTPGSALAHRVNSSSARRPPAAHPERRRHIRCSLSALLRGCLKAVLEFGKQYRTEKSGSSTQGQVVNFDLFVLASPVMSDHGLVCTASGWRQLTPAPTPDRCLPGPMQYKGRRCLIRF